MNEVGATVLKDWVQTENKPADVINPHSMQVGPNGYVRSFSYMADEIEKNMMLANPAVFAKCKFDSHKAAQKKAGLQTLVKFEDNDEQRPIYTSDVFEEAQRLHHTDTYWGNVAQAYSMMISAAFKKAQNDAGSNSTISEDELRKNALTEAEKAECKAMAGKCGDYQKEYKCSVDQPRFYLHWLKAKTWKEIMASEKLKEAFFQDRCCRGDKKALQPGKLANLS